VATADARIAAGGPWLPFVARVMGATEEVDRVSVDTLDRDDEGGLRITGRGVVFAATAAWTPAGLGDGTVRRWDVTLELTCEAVAPVKAGIVVALRLDLTDDPAWLIPGLFYGENRRVDCRRRYPRFTRAPAPDDDLASDHWSFRSDRAATPSVTARDGRFGATLATTETSPLGPTGLGFAALDDATEIHLAFPFREEPVVYDGFERALPAEVRLHAWAPGERVELRFRVYLHGREPGAFAPVLRDLHAWLAADAPLAPWVDPPAAARLAAHGLLRWHYRAEPGVLYETAAFERRGDGTADEATDRRAMHVGWLSGSPAACALIAHGTRTGDAAAIDAGTRVIDAIVATPAPCGTLWGQWTANGGWGKGWTPGEDRLHARTLGEAVLFLGRALAHVPAGSRRATAWRATLAANLAFVADRQRGDGALPAQWHGRTGAVEGWAGSAGLAWVPALVEGATVLAEPHLLDVARRAGRFYADQVEEAFLFGAPEDVDLAPSSEDGYVAVMAYVALADAETDPAARARWVALARRSADWMLTFRYSYNVAFEPGSMLGRHDYRSRGADQASPANQHLHAYGLIALPEMVRLAQLTGDAWYLERTRENLACFRQFIARHDGDFGARRGMAPERYYQTNCFGPKGEIGPLSHAWCLGLLLWACDAAADLPELAEAGHGA
jgi:hypothetical protein